MRARVALGAMVVATLATPAVADSTLLPQTRLIVDLPSTWRLYREDAGRDSLRSHEGGNLSLGVIAGSSCDVYFVQQSLLLDVEMTDAKPSYLPAAWKAVTWKDAKGDPSFLACHEVGKFAVAVQWWTEVNTAWQTEMTALFTAVEAYRIPTGASARDSLIPLVGSGLFVQLPEEISVVKGGPEGTDELEGGGKQLALGKGTDPCDTAFAKLAHVDGTAASVAGWKHASTGSAGELFCFESSKVALLGPEATPGLTALLESIAGETESIEHAESARLQGSGYYAALPKAWRATGDGGATRVATDGGVAFTIHRSAEACATVTQTGGTHEPYHPTWQPTAWTASLDTSADRVTECATTTKRGSIVVDAPRAMVQGRLRSAFAALLGDLVERGDYTPPKLPHAPLLGPFSLFVAGLATQHDNESHGYGVNGSLRVDRYSGVLSLRGDVGWDNRFGVSYDGNFTLALPVSGGAMVGTAGRDAIGSGDTSRVAPDWYYGGGVRLGKIETNGAYFFELLVCARHQPKTADPMVPIDESLHPGHEVRMRLEGLDRKVSGVIAGFAAEYRWMGASGMGQIGLFTRF